jgi:hypothetical protein
MRGPVREMKISTDVYRTMPVEQLQISAKQGKVAKVVATAYKNPYIGERE